VSTFAPTAVPFRDGQLALIEVGDGPAITYMHGMLGNPGEHGFLRSLAATGRKVTAPSLPSFTGSSACEDLRSLHDWVVAASEMIDLVGAAGAPLVASSVGAMMALELACIRPEAFSEMVLIAPFGLWDETDPIADPFATTLGEQRRMLTADPTVSASFFDDPDGLAADELVEHGVDRYLTRTASAALIWPIPEFGLANRLHRVQCPVTLVWGSEDRIIPPTYADRFAARLSNHRATHIVDGAGHQAEFDRPDAVASIVGAALGN
jgi:pimeloyl-ACP methyl ester carboxylesterase